MKRHRFHSKITKGQDEFAFSGEIWVRSPNEAVACLDYPDNRSQSLFTKALIAVTQTIQEQYGLESPPQVYNQVGVGRYSSSHTGSVAEKNYGEVCQEGYGLIGLSARFFIDGGREDLISVSKTEWPTSDDAVVLEAETHLWKGTDRRGIVIFNFPPDDKWPDLLREESNDMMVASHFGLAKGRLVFFPLRDDPERGRLFTSLNEYLDPGHEGATATYSEIKDMALDNEDFGLGAALNDISGLGAKSAKIEPGL